MSKKKKKRRITDAAKILEREFIKDDRRRKRLQETSQVLDVAGQIYNHRMKAGLTQQKLAELIGTSQSDISRLENADYNGHTLKMLQKIAEAVHCCIELKFVPNRQHAYAH